MGSTIHSIGFFFMVLPRLWRLADLYLAWGGGRGRGKNTCEIEVYIYPNGGPFSPSFPGFLASPDKNTVTEKIININGTVSRDFRCPHMNFKDRAWVPGVLLKVLSGLSFYYYT